MEIFVLIKRVLTFSGLIPIDHLHGKCLSIFIRCLSFVIFVASMIASVWYCSYEAETFLDRAMSFTAIVITLYLMSVYVSLILCIDRVVVTFTMLQAKVQERT